MEQNEDRRALDRIRIAGAEVFYRFSKEMHLLAPFNGPGPLEDLTWSSLRFTTDKSLHAGEMVEVELSIPHEDKIRIRGYLIWTSDLPIQDKYYAVVQFLPYGTGRMYNSLKVKDRLQELVDKYKTLEN